MEIKKNIDFLRYNNNFSIYEDENYLIREINLKNKIPINICIYYCNNMIKEINYNFKEYEWSKFSHFLKYITRKYFIFLFKYDVYLNNFKMEKDFNIIKIPNNSKIFLKIILEENKELNYFPKTIDIFNEKIDYTLIHNFEISNNYGKIQFLDLINIENINFNKIIKIDLLNISFNYDIEKYLNKENSFLKSKVKITYLNPNNKFDLSINEKEKLYNNIELWIKNLGGFDIFYKYNEFYFSFLIDSLIELN